MWENPQPNGSDPFMWNFTMEVLKNDQWQEHSSLYMSSNWDLQKRMKICNWSESAWEKVRVVAYNKDGRGAPSEEIEIIKKNG